MKKAKKKAKKKEYFFQNRIFIYLAVNKWLLCHALLWGVPFAASCVLGWRLVHVGTAFGPGGSAAAYVGSFLLFLLETAVLTVPAAGLAALALRGSTGRDTLRQRPVWQMWLFYSLLIFLCWLPVFLAYYPSVFAYDAEGQLYQVIAKDYSTHHPLLHTLFLGAFFKLGEAVGSYQTGMAVHSAVQMLLMAAAFGYVLSRLYERGTPRWIRALLLLFYGLFPANSVLALSTTKDVLFAALVLLYTVKMCEIAWKDEGALPEDGGKLRTDAGKRAETQPASGVGNVIAFAVLAVLMLLFRNNAVYAFVLSVPIVYFGLREGGRRKESGGRETEKGRVRSGKTARKIWLYLAVITLILFGVCAFLLKTATHARSGSPREMLSVPLQQMARVRVTAEERIDPAMRQELDQYIPSEWIFAAYNPHLADPVKNRAVIHDDPVGLIKIWLRLGLRFPSIYVDAFLDNSLGMWYLWDTSHAEIYGIGTESGFGWLSTDNRTMPAGCEIVERSFLPDLRVGMERIVSDNVYRKLPFVRLLFAPAFYWWLLWFYLVAALYRQRRREALPAVFLTVYYLTLLLSPTVIVRYLYPLMVTAPVILPCVLRKDTDKIQENTQ